VIEVRILIVATKKPKQRFLVKLHTDELIDEVKNLINKRKHSQAMVYALSKGIVEKHLTQHEICHTDANLILTEDAARWDLIKN
jgi:hypothetical protein